MTTLLWAIDITLALTLVGLAIVVLTTADPFRAIVLFIAFGLVLAIVWARLQAVDIALAEAAIGAGLTGALFLNALAAVEARDAEWPDEPAADAGQWWRFARLVVAVLATGFAVVAGAALWDVAPEHATLLPRVQAAIPESGVVHPVTAVLLNFRAYDTLLEVAVLVLAIVGVWALVFPAAASTRVQALRPLPPGPVLLGLVAVLLPVILLVAGYVLWAGTTAPGGAFQAGAILAAGGVLLLVVGSIAMPPPRQRRVRAAVVAGLAVFLAVGVSVMASGRALLEYPPRWSGPMILLIESVLALSIAVVLVALFAGTRERSSGRARPEQVEGR
jgi:multisubunit Na+/H+ antiporter MnhB subunit